MLGADHSTVCKFETKFGGYMIVLDRLKKIRVELLSNGVVVGNNPQNVLAV